MSKDNKLFINNIKFKRESIIDKIIEDFREFKRRNSNNTFVSFTLKNMYVKSAIIDNLILEPKDDSQINHLNILQIIDSIINGDFKLTDIKLIGYYNIFHFNNMLSYDNKVKNISIKTSKNINSELSKDRERYFYKIKKFIEKNKMSLNRACKRNDVDIINDENVIEDDITYNNKKHINIFSKREYIYISLENVNRDKLRINCKHDNYVIYIEKSCIKKLYIHSNNFILFTHDTDIDKLIIENPVKISKYSKFNCIASLFTNNCCDKKVRNIIFIVLGVIIIFITIIIIIKMIRNNN